MFETVVFVASAIGSLGSLSSGNRSLKLYILGAGTDALFLQVLLPLFVLAPLGAEVMRVWLAPSALRLVTVGLSLLWPAAFIAAEPVPGSVNDLVYLAVLPVYAAVVRLPGQPVTVRTTYIFVSCALIAVVSLLAASYWAKCSLPAAPL